MTGARGPEPSRLCLPMRRLALLLPLLLVATGACRSGHKSADTIKPIPTLPTVTTTTVPDLSGVQLAGVPGRTTTTVGIGPGAATLKGTVQGPDGPVGGATIHVERLVADAVSTQDFASNADGTFTIPQIRGGRYRVRAYVPNPYNLAQVAPVLLFLGGTETQQLTLEMGAFVGVAVSSSIAPRPPVIEEPASLVVLVTTQSVDDKGVVRGEAVGSVKVELFGSTAWRVQTANPSVTDSQGQAAFRLTCSAEGAQQLSVTVNDTDSRPLDIPACVEAPPTTTTEVVATVPAPETTVPGPTTTGTTRPGATTTAPTTTTTAGPSTTTTTRPVTTTTTTRPPSTTTTTRKP